MRPTVLSLARRHRRLTGVLFAVALGAAYLGVLRPLRVLGAEAVALPLFEAVGTPRAEGFDLVARPGSADVYAFPEGTLTTGLTEDEMAAVARWSSPAGALFVLPAMFLIAAFPLRRYWLLLLGYHLAVGAVALGVFVIGLGWAGWAFSLYSFSQTYVLETISLAIPLLLWLAGRAEEAADPPVVVHPTPAVGEAA